MAVYQDLRDSSQTDSIVTSYALLEGYASDHEEIKGDFVYTDQQTGLTKSFFLPNGKVDWDAVVENDGTFQELIDKLPFERYSENYAKGQNDEAIDPRTIPRPTNPSLPPNP